MQRFSRLDGLRGVLAVYVMLGHALPFTVLPGWVQWPLSHGESAVDLFFALSGLVIINAVERFEGRFWPFMRARALRLLPVYFLVFVGAVALLLCPDPLVRMPWVGPDGHSFWSASLPAPFWAHVLAHLTLTQGLIPQGLLPYAYITLLGPAWSLSTEFQFYVVIGLWAPRHLRAAALVFLAAGIAYQAAVPLLPESWSFSRAFLLDAAPYFALGLVSASWVRGEGLVCLLVCALLVAWVGLAEGSGRVLLPLVWLLVLWAQRHPAGRWLEHPVWQFLGTVSYPLYLLNEPVQRGLALLLAPLGPVWFSVVWLPLSLVVAIVLAWLAHVVVEKPALFGPLRAKLTKVFLLLRVPMTKRRSREV